MRKLCHLLALIGLLLGILPAPEVKAASPCGSAAAAADICALPAAMPQRAAQLPDPSCSATQVILLAMILPDGRTREGVAEPQPFAQSLSPGLPPETPWKPPRLLS